MNAQQIFAALADADRRIDNMEFLLAHKRDQRRRLVEELRAALGRSSPRTTFMELDTRRQPVTARYCVMCRRDIGSGAPTHEVRLVKRGAAPCAVLVADIPLLDLGVLEIEQGDEDCGAHSIGTDCAHRLGADWTRPEREMTTRMPQDGKEG